MPCCGGIASEKVFGCGSNKDQGFSFSITELMEFGAVKVVLWATIEEVEFGGELIDGVKIEKSH